MHCQRIFITSHDVKLVNSISCQSSGYFTWIDLTFMSILQVTYLINMQTRWHFFLNNIYLSFWHFLSIENWPGKKCHPVYRKFCRTAFCPKILIYLMTHKSDNCGSRNIPWENSFSVNSYHDWLTKTSQSTLFCLLYQAI